MNWAQRIVWPVLLLCLGFAVYIPSLKFSFILDDHRFTADPRIQESGHIFDYFSNFVWAQVAGGPASFYRPVFVLWLRLNFVLAELSPWGWHFLSIAKHLLVGIALWILLRRLLNDRLAAFAAVAVFLLHPSHTESVSWVTVPDPLLTLALLLSLLFYLRYVDSFAVGAQTQSRKSRRSAASNRSASGLWLMASVVAYFAALLAKETATVFPLVILALAVSNEGMHRARDGPSKTELAAARRRAFAQVGLFAGVSMVYLLIRWSALNGRLAPATQHLPWSTIVLSWPGTLWFYMKALLSP